MSFALVLKKTSWYRRRYSRPLGLKKKAIPNIDHQMVPKFIFIKKRITKY